METSDHNPMSPVGSRGAPRGELTVCSDPGPLNMEFRTSDHRRNPKSHPKRRPLRRLRNLASSRSEVANAKFLSPTIHMSRRSLQTDQINPYRQALGAAPLTIDVSSYVVLRYYSMLRARALACGVADVDTDARRGSGRKPSPAQDARDTKTRQEHGRAI